MEQFREAFPGVLLKSFAFANSSKKTLKSSLMSSKSSFCISVFSLKSRLFAFL